MTTQQQTRRATRTSWLLPSDGTEYPQILRGSVWRTGGLEAAIAAHVVSNVLTYVLAGVTTSVATVRAVEEIGWVDAAIDVAGFAVVAVVAVLVAQLMSLRHRVDLASTRP